MKIEPLDHREIIKLYFQTESSDEFGDIVARIAQANALRQVIDYINKKQFGTKLEDLQSALVELEKETKK